MQQLFAFLCLIFVNLIFCTGATHDTHEDEALIVHLSHGKLRGKDNGEFYSYESIPYAQPPVGELRFESPKPYTQRWSGVFDATQPPPICLQLNPFVEGADKVNGQEDCLTMNIYKPKLANESSHALLPVLVDIHGGTFEHGLIDRIGTTNLMTSHKFIVVKFTYRLGPLGFLSAEDHHLPGNYGLKDQRLALKWIKENIHHFGGDTKNILVQGLAAGGASVHYHMLRPEFKSIAKAAVSLSGTALLPWALVRSARKGAFEMAKHLKCHNVETSTDLKRCLKSKNAADIVRHIRDFWVFDSNPFVIFGPVVEPANVEDAFITQAPELIIKSGNFSQIPWLVGYAAQDGGFNAAELLRKTPQGHDMIEMFNTNWNTMAPHVLFFKDTIKSSIEQRQRATHLKQHYLGNKRFSFRTYLNVQRMYSDVLYKKDSLRSIDMHRKHHAPVYGYVYDIATEESLATLLAQRDDVKFGAVLGSDYFTVQPLKFFRKAQTTAQKSIASKLINMLASFLNGDGGVFYDHCKFNNNVGRKKLSVMLIKKNSCENKNVNSF